jgi:hypothetical protein
MTYTMNMKKTITTAGVGLLSFTALNADTFVYGNAAGGNWDNTAADGWATFPGGVTGGLPTSTDSPIINQNKTIVVNSAITFGGALQVANTNKAAHSSALSVQAGSITTGSLTTAYNVTSTGAVDISGGTLTNNGALVIGATGSLDVSGTGAYVDGRTGSRDVFDGGVLGQNGQINISDGSFTSNGAGANDLLTLEDLTVNVAGGTLNLTGGQLVGSNTNTATINIIGDIGNAVQVDRLNTSLGRTINFGFEFDATGVGTVVSAGSYISFSSLNIAIDGTDYLGGTDSFLLFESANIVGDTEALSESIDGFDTGSYTTELRYDFTTDDVYLDVTAIPEPGTCALIGGLLALGAVMVRRRR